MKRKIIEDDSFFHYSNLNPKNRKTGDCAVRAIAAATGKSWENVLTELFSMALKTKHMVNSRQCIDAVLVANGFKKQKQPKKDDGCKYTGREFCEVLQNDSFVFTGYDGPQKSPIVANIGTHHIVCIAKGKVNDTWYSADGCIGNYYTKEC